VIFLLLLSFLLIFLLCFQFFCSVLFFSSPEQRGEMEAVLGLGTVVAERRSWCARGQRWLEAVLDRDTSSGMSTVRWRILHGGDCGDWVSNEGITGWQLLGYCGEIHGFAGNEMVIMKGGM
jgi:hypothetical protein